MQTGSAALPASRAPVSRFRLRSITLNAIPPWKTSLLDSRPFHARKPFYYRIGQGQSPCVRVLLDECIHVGVKAAFSGQTAKSVTETGWRSSKDGPRCSHSRRTNLMYL